MHSQPACSLPCAQTPQRTAGILGQMGFRETAASACAAEGSGHVTFRQGPAARGQWRQRRQHAGSGASTCRHRRTICALRLQHQLLQVLVGRHPSGSVGLQGSNSGGWVEAGYDWRGGLAAAVAVWPQRKRSAPGCLLTARLLVSEHPPCPPLPHTAAVAHPLRRWPGPSAPCPACRLGRKHAQLAEAKQTRLPKQGAVEVHAPSCNARGITRRIPPLCAQPDPQQPNRALTAWTAQSGSPAQPAPTPQAPGE